MSRLDNFSSYIEAAMQTWHTPGTAVSIVKGDEALFQQVFGVRDVEENLPLTEDTRFPIASGEGMQACTVGSLDWSDFRHYHFDVFEWHHPDFDFRMKVRFLTNDNGEIDSVSIPIEPAVENVVFKRKPVELPDELNNALLGEYLLPFGGLTITITHLDGKFYATQTGGSAQEIKPYKLDETIVGLRDKEMRFDFAREDGLITKLILKFPGQTFEAPRK
jgi:hypothetical protein